MRTNQHCPSQAIIRKFATADEKVWVLDKCDGRIFQSNPKNVFGIVGRFDVPKTIEPNVTADKTYTNVEGPGLKIVDEILQRKDVGWMDRKKSRALEKFVFGTFAGSTNVRASEIAYHPDRIKKLESAGVETFGVNGTEDHAKTCFCVGIMHLGMNAGVISKGRKLILRLSDSGGYVLGDSPVVKINLRNKDDKLAYIGSDQVEIFFPISRNATLHYYNPIERCGWGCGDMPVPQAQDEQCIHDGPGECALLNFLQLNHAERWLVSDDKRKLECTFEISHKLPDVRQAPRYIVA